MDPNESTKQVTLDLYRTLYPQYKENSDAEIADKIKEQFGLDINTISDDDLVQLVQTIQRRKKKSIAQPLPASTTSPTPLRAPAETDFKTGDKVRHTNRLEWGYGIILAAETFPMSGRFLQRVYCDFEKAGKKTLIIQPGLLMLIKD